MEGGHGTEILVRNRRGHLSERGKRESVVVRERKTTGVFLDPSRTEKLTKGPRLLREGDCLGVPTISKSKKQATNLVTRFYLTLGKKEGICPKNSRKKGLAERRRPAGGGKETRNRAGRDTCSANHSGSPSRGFLPRHTWRRKKNSTSRKDREILRENQRGAKEKVEGGGNGTGTSSGPLGRTKVLKGRGG